MTKKLTRRTFMTDVAVAGAGLTILPRHVLGRGQTAPSDRMNVAAVGVGGQGRSDLVNLATENIVALCDVDWEYANKGFAALDTDIASQQARLDRPAGEPRLDAQGRPEPPLTALERQRMAATIDRMKRLKEALPRAARYQDFRQMLDKQKDIDGVVIATPDHMHATIALAAMDLGKHVYVQKPLTWSIAEARQLARRSKGLPKLATQMGNQGHSWDDARTAVEYVWAGAIGDVREIHIWTNRPLGYWPQGIPRPEVRTPPENGFRWNGPGIEARLATAMAGSFPKPQSLDWDLFLGVGPAVDYHPVYHPFNWRGWVDWGVGAIGDMGAHLIDHSLWALDLGYPTTIETVCTPFNGVCYPHATMTMYEFPPRGSKPAVKLTWYDGGLLPKKPVEIGEDELNKTGGALLVGSKGKLLHDTYGKNPRLLPKSLHDSFGTPPRKLARIPNENHEMNWVEAAKGHTSPSCPFAYAAQLTEIMLLGVVALRAGKKIEYDAKNMRVTNIAAANEFLQRETKPARSL